MTELIERFKREHHEIDRALKEAKLLGVATKEGHERLLEAKDLIIKHLQEENEQLYPPLERASGSSAVIKEDLERFKETLKPVTDKAISFFEKYDQPSEYDQESEKAELCREIIDIITMIESRIDQEENIFYPHFNSVLAVA